MDTTSAPAWQQPGHFQAGDSANLVHRDGVRFPERYLVTAEQAQTGYYLDGNFRHPWRCQACKDDVAQLRQAQEITNAINRSRFEIRAVARADTLRFNGIEEGRLATDAPLPNWLHAELRNARLYHAEGPWPEFTRTQHPVDWPTLLDQHPGFLALDENLEHNAAVPWPDVQNAFRTLQQAGHTPWRDAVLSVNVFDQVAIFYTNLGVIDPANLHPDTTTTIDTLLLGAGRPADALHDSTTEDPFYWRLAL